MTTHNARTHELTHERTRDLYNMLARLSSSELRDLAAGILARADALDNSDPGYIRIQSDQPWEAGIGDDAWARFAVE